MQLSDVLEVIYMSTEEVRSCVSGGGGGVSVLCNVMRSGVVHGVME